MINIAIDGPSGAGKSTVAKALAKKLSYIYVDTGAMYRAVGLYARNRGTDKNDKEGVIALLPEIRIDLLYENGAQHVLLNGGNVSTAIRENEISMYASCVSKIPEVRAFLSERQREMGRTQNVIMDGRDIGTVILPDAQVKIFLFASPEARAERRVKELLEKGQNVTYDTILSEMRERDEQDRTREIAPAVPAEDAVLMDNSHMTIEENVNAVLEIMRERGLLPEGE